MALFKIMFIFGLFCGKFYIEVFLSVYTYVKGLRLVDGL